MEKYLRVYRKFYFDELKTHTLLYGALSGSCSNCRTLDIKLDAHDCPSCKTPFKYIAFQNLRDHFPKLMRLAAERPEIQFIDYDDFKRIDGEIKASNILR